MLGRIKDWVVEASKQDTLLFIRTLNLPVSFNGLCAKGARWQKQSHWQTLFGMAGLLTVRPISADIRSRMFTDKANSSMRALATSALPLSRVAFRIILVIRVDVESMLHPLAPEHSVLEDVPVACGWSPYGGGCCQRAWGSNRWVLA